MISKEIESIIKNLNKTTTTKNLGPDDFMWKYYQIFKEESMPIPSKLPKNWRSKNSKLILKVRISLMPNTDKDNTRNLYINILMNIDEKILNKILANWIQ